MIRRGRLALFAAALALAFTTGCGGDEVPAAQFGRRAFADPRVSTSPFNVFSCATCHQVTAGALPLEIGVAHAGRIDPGYNLYDTVHRGGWWGGYKTQLLDAINTCVDEFMGGGFLKASDPVARQLYEYLADNSPTDPASPLPLTVVKTITSVGIAPGDATRGQDVYDRACKRCHGPPHTGAGRLGRSSIVPEATALVFPSNTRAAIIEKIRHGRFFNIGGQMPLFSAEAISDPEIGDILAYLGL